MYFFTVFQRTTDIILKALNGLACNRNGVFLEVETEFLNTI